MLQFGLPPINSLIIGIIAVVAEHHYYSFPAHQQLRHQHLNVSGWRHMDYRRGLLPGIVSIALGIIVLVFPHILNYLAGLYLILLALWFIFAISSLIIDLITIAVGIIVMVFPDILNYVFGIYLLITGLIAIGHYYGWF